MTKKRLNPERRAKEAKRIASNLASIPIGHKHGKDYHLSVYTNKYKETIITKVSNHKTNVQHMNNLTSKGATVFKDAIGNLLKCRVVNKVSFHYYPKPKVPKARHNVPLDKSKLSALIAKHKLERYI